MGDLILSQLPILPVVRVLAVATSFPILAGPGAPRLIRIAVGFVLAVMLIPRPLLQNPGDLSGVSMLLALPFEIMVGFAIGYAFALLFHALAIAGDFLGQEMGLNAASQIDPVSGRPVPLLARLFEVIGLVFFMEMGGMRLLLETVKTSFVAVPVGILARPGQIGRTLTELSTETVVTGIAIALPAGLLLMLLTMFTTIAARVLPKLHIFDFAYAVRMMMAIFLVGLLLPRLIPATTQFMTMIVQALRYGLSTG
ncbi:MAG: flagellar biosynthetic protein FliR [Planctomycetota bacterium]